MRYLRYVAVVLFLASVPLFLVVSNVRWVINTPQLYSYGFDKYNIPTQTGIERSELLSAAKQIRAYFNNDADYLDVTVLIEGQERSLYNNREILHMKDVKGLVQRVYRIQWLTGAYLAAFAIVGLALLRRRFLPILGRYVGFGGGVTIGLVLATGIASLVGFDRLFLTFHLVSFSNDLWQLDPSRDNLIAMFPQEFFFDATMWIAISTIVEALLLTLAPLVLLWWRPRWAQRAMSGLGQPAWGR